VVLVSRNVKATAVLGDELVEQEMPDKELMGHRVCKRIRKSNPRVKGPEWVSPTM
jgi:hypothetical protein